MLLSKTLSMFVLDEADLLLLHEYEGDLQAIAPQVMVLHSVHIPSYKHCSICLHCLVYEPCLGITYQPATYNMA